MIALFLLIFSNVISNKRIIGPIDWTAFFNNTQACKSKNMVTLISTLVLFQCQIKFLIFIFQIHWKMSLMDAFCAKFDWNCFSGSELGVLLAFLLLFYYLPLEKGVVLYYQNKRPVRLHGHLIIILYIDFCQRAHIHTSESPS